MLIRGMIHLLVTDLITASRVVDRAVAHGAEDHDARRVLRATGGSSPARSSLPRKTGDRLYRELKEFIYQRHHPQPRASRSTTGGRSSSSTTLFGAYYRNPRLLPDYVLLRYRDLAGVAYLRDIPLKRLEAEIAGNYHEKPLFLRCIADHLAGMTDSYALAEYDTMVSAYPRRRAGSPRVTPGALGSVDADRLRRRPRRLRAEGDA